MQTTLKLPQANIFKRHSIIFKAVLTGGIIGLSYSGITNAGENFQHLALLPGIVIGISISLTVIVFELCLSKLNNYPFLIATFIKALLYSLSILIILLISVLIFTKILSQYTYQEALSNYIKNRLAGDFIFSLGASLFLILFLEISSLLSTKFFYNYFTGKYHRPVPEDRIFMFVDLKSSTTIAEQLGDVLYSKMLQDLFADFTDAILASRAEIYQYAGDEVILTWKTTTGLKEGRCLFCFYLIKEYIKKRQDYYQQNYNTLPRFKAGMHVGTAVTAWVGKVKKEIAYHGDLLNTTSRIQYKCNELNHDFVISEEIQNKIPEGMPVTYSLQGEISLKGKLHPIKLYTVDFNL